MLDTSTARTPFDVNDLEEDIADVVKQADLYGLKRQLSGNPTIIETRQTTHGDFARNAELSQALKRILRAAPGWENITDIEREVMDMISLKFSRILSGKSQEKQHWEDVVGYGQLAELDCK